MTFNALLADLDATAFAELADDTAAIWTKPGGDPVYVAAMFDAGQRVTLIGQLPTISSGELVRLSAAEVAAKAPGKEPADGDTISINGLLLTIHGQPRLDEEMNGRDWLCPVTR